MISRVTIKRKLKKISPQEVVSWVKKWSLENVIHADQSMPAHINVQDVYITALSSNNFDYTIITNISDIAEYMQRLKVGNTIFVQWSIAKKQYPTHENTTRKDKNEKFNFRENK